MEIGLVTAFLGGTLALLSPCGALLLPAFFASNATTSARLAGHAAVFYAGLVAALAPLGFAAGTLGSFFATYRAEVVMLTSVLLIVLGIVQALGRGFDPGRWVPGARQLPQQAATRRGLPRTFALGAASGLVGVCTGPILGAVLTLAAAQGDAVAAVVLLAVYGAGMVAPLVVLAVAWQRIGARTHRFLRGRTLVIAGRPWHTTSVITGVLIAGLGVAFWTTNGLVRVPELVPIDIQLRLQELIGRLSDTRFDIIAIVVTAVGSLAIWGWRRNRTSDPTPTTSADA